MARTKTKVQQPAPEPADITPVAQADGAAAAAPSQDRSDEIARRAYQRYQTRGGEHGRDLEDWFEAEQSLGPDEPSAVDD
jgi:hypothetical protein